MKKVVIISLILSLFCRCYKQREETLDFPMEMFHQEFVEIFLLLEEETFSAPRNLLETEMLSTIKIYGERSVKEIPFELSENNRYLKFIPALPYYSEIKHQEIDVDEGLRYTYAYAKTHLLIKGQKVVLDCEFVYPSKIQLDGSSALIANSNPRLTKIKIGNDIIKRAFGSRNKIILPLVYRNGKISVK